MPTKTNGKPRPRGFAAMPEKTKLRICAMGGKATAKKLGRAHMSRIGKRGRAKRARNERKARKAFYASPPPQPTTIEVAGTVGMKRVKNPARVLSVSRNQQ